MKQSRPGQTTHGMARTPEYRIWAAMKRRCLNPKVSNYPLYGGRGIEVCKRWTHSFECFLRDMGKRPKGKTLDRWPNKNGNYKPGNCRWANWSEQAFNRRKRGKNKNPFHRDPATFAHWHQLPQTKLNPRKVRKIRVLGTGGLTQTQIANRFGVSRTLVRKILKGDAWKHVH